MAEQWPFKPLVESSSLSALTEKVLVYGGFFFNSFVESSPFGDRRVFALTEKAFKKKAFLFNAN
jgi:hypothetical protein